VAKIPGNRPIAGDVRRNALSDFANVFPSGKIAMTLPEGVSLVNARICSSDDDVMLVTAGGRAIRWRHQLPTRR